MRFARVLALLGLGLAGCAPPLQNGGVELRDGAAGRLGFFCRYRGGAGPFCAPPPTAAPVVRAARARAWDPDADALGGPSVEARAGDLVLANDEIAVVIGGTARSAEDGAGALLDAVDARVGVDELARVTPSLGAGHALVVEGVSTGRDERTGRAWVDVRARDAAQGITLRTRYALDPAARAVAIESLAALSARVAGSSVAPPAIEDDVAWGDAAPLAFEGARAAVGQRVSYALVPGARDVESSRARAVRWFVVGARGDALAIATELDALTGASLGALSLRFLDEHGAPTAAPPGARIAVARADEPAEVARRPRWIRVVDLAAPVEAEIAPGCYRVSLVDPPASARPVTLLVHPAEVAFGALVLLGPEAATALAQDRGATDDAARSACGTTGK